MVHSVVAKAAMYVWGFLYSLHLCVIYQHRVQDMSWVCAPCHVGGTIGSCFWSLHYVENLQELEVGRSFSSICLSTSIPSKLSNSSTCGGFQHGEQISSVLSFIRPTPFNTWRSCQLPEPLRNGWPPGTVDGLQHTNASLCWSNGATPNKRLGAGGGLNATTSSTRP